MTTPDNEMEALLQELKHRSQEEVEFIVNKVRHSPHVFEVKHTTDQGVLLELKPSKKLYFIVLMGRPSKALNYPDNITKQYEGSQPHCAIGSYNESIDLTEAIALADKAHAAWHTSPFGVPITRAIEEIIKMDWGMRVFGCFIP